MFGGEKPTLNVAAELFFCGWGVKMRAGDGVALRIFSTCLVRPGMLQEVSYEP